MKLRKLILILMSLCLMANVACCGKNKDEDLVTKLGYTKVPTVEKDYSGLETIKVACVGDSITFGGYWEDLKRLLDDRFKVMGFGENGSTVLFDGLDNGDIPKAYKDQLVYESSQLYKADIVVIMLGTNDSKECNWSQTEKSDGKLFIDNYIELVKSYQSLETEPMVFLALPPTAFSDIYGISNTTIEEDIIPAIEVVAAATGAVIIDTHSANVECGEADYFDGVHPSSLEGRRVLAEAVKKAVLEDVDE